jgi:hypothetical protein
MTGFQPKRDLHDTKKPTLIMSPFGSTPSAGTEVPTITTAVMAAAEVFTTTIMVIAAEEALMGIAEVAIRVVMTRRTMGLTTAEAAGQPGCVDHNVADATSGGRIGVSSDTGAG